MSLYLYIQGLLKASVQVSLILMIDAYFPLRHWPAPAQYPGPSFQRASVRSRQRELDWGQNQGNSLIALTVLPVMRHRGVSCLCDGKALH